MIPMPLRPQLVLLALASPSDGKPAPTMTLTPFAYAPLLFSLAGRRLPLSLDGRIWD